MRMRLLIGLLAVALAVPAANAVITGATFQADDDGALDMLATVHWGSFDINFLAIGTQYWGPGHLNGEVYTDTLQDPAATSNNTILNDTGTTWTGYTLNVYMNKSFNITAATGPANWTNAIVADIPGSYTDVDGRSWSHKGTVNYTSSAPVYDIADGSSGTFGVSFNWLGGSAYQLELIPVPEPMSLALLALGGLFLRRRIR